ncbi:MAG: hypothetical protein J6L47_03815 [Alphaproteobacteria bacterium]|nr:hypothetical protein [Alphaproteobacteria bacterium]
MPNLNVGLSLAFMTCQAHALTDRPSIGGDDFGFSTYPFRCVVTDGIGQSDSASNCASVTAFVNCGTSYGGTYVDCGTCESGHDRTYTTRDIGGETLGYYTCSRSLIIIGCDSECADYTSWTAISGGRETYCDLSWGTCRYRCAANYYGDGTSCSPCTSYNGIAATSPAGSMSESSCCISSGSTYSFSDGVGSGTATITSTCCAS